MTRELEGVKEIEEMINGFEMMLKGFETTPPQLKSEPLFFGILKKHYQNLHEANLSHKTIGASGLFIPTELLYAMGITQLFPEFHSIFGAMMMPSEVFNLMDVAEGYGLSNEICSPHRVYLGMAKSKMLPRPDFIIGTSTTCDQTLKSHEILSHVYGCPDFMLDTPYGSSERDFQYAKEEIRSLIKFLEEQTGQKLDYDRLKEAVKLSKVAYDYLDKICALKKSVPCPLGGRDNIKDFGVLMLAGGLPEAIEYFEVRYEEIKNRVDQKLSPVPEEKHRIAWLYVLPLFDLGIADWMEQEYGAVIVMDTMSYSNPNIELDPSEPIEFLAKKNSKRGFIQLGWGTGDSTKFPEVMANQVKEYQADAAMVLAHWSCRQYCATIKTLRDEITAQTGIPFLILDGDILDSRVVSSAQLKAKITQFFNTMGSQQ